MAISNESNSKQEIAPVKAPRQDVAEVLPQANRIPIPGCFDLEVRSMTRRKQTHGVGQHEIRYRSIIGRRFSVIARSALSDAQYLRVPSNDQLGNDGSWSHAGATESGRRGSNHPTAEYLVDEAVLHGGALPGVKVFLTLTGDAPLDRTTDVICKLSIE